MTICYFTASGNSLYVSRRIGGTLISIPQMMKQETIKIEDEAVGIVCPVYAGEIPMMVRDFLNKADIRTNYLFFICTCGTSRGAAFEHVEMIAREHGWDLKYAGVVLMVDNYLPGFEMKHQIDTLPKKDVEGQLSRLCGEIESRKERRVKVSAVNRLMSEMFHKTLAKSILKKDRAQSYIVNDACVHCGICAKVCPANNITLTTDKVIFSDHCEVCYACLHNCPQNAIHLKRERSTVRFRNEHVSVKDIIEANE